MEKQMIGELNIRRSLEDVVQGIRRAFYGNSKTGSLELEVPFERLHLPGHGKFSRHANVTLGEREERFDGATLIPLEWRDAESSPNFPRFEGYFEILPLDPDVSQVAIVGDYVPPLGPLGAAFDAAVGRHVAEATVEELLERLRSTLEKAR
jgi:hypothetical protein